MLLMSETICIFAVDIYIQLFAMGTVKKITRTTTDVSGNEFTEVTEIQIQHNHKEEPFYKTYIDYVGWMYDINNGAAKSVLVYFMEHAEYNTGLVRFTAIDRKQLMMKLNLSRAGLYKAIKYLEKVSAVTSVEYEGAVGGQYMINPQMFWKGDKNMRSDLMVSFCRIINDPVDADGFPVKDVEDIKKL